MKTNNLLLSSRAFLFLGMALLPAAAMAGWYMSCPACARHLGGSGIAGPYSSEAQCTAARNEAKRNGNYPYQACYQKGGSSPDASGGGGGSSDLANSILSIIKQASIDNQRQAQESARIGAESAAQNQNTEQSIREEERRRLGAVDARTDELRRRRQALISQLHGSVTGQNSEFALPDSESKTIDVQRGTNFFGLNANPSGTLEVGGEGAGLVIPMPAEPPTPEGKAVAPTQAQLAVTEYWQAVAVHADADLQRKKNEHEKKVAEQMRLDAEKQYQEQQARVAQIPPDQPEVKKEEDDKLAAAEKLLEEATDLDEKATKNLDKAQQDLKKATLDLDRSAAKKSSAQAAQEKTTQGQAGSVQAK